MRSRGKPARLVLRSAAAAVCDQALKLQEEPPSPRLAQAAQHTCKGRRANAPADHRPLVGVHPVHGFRSCEISRIGLNNERVGIPLVKPGYETALMAEIERSAQQVCVDCSGVPGPLRQSGSDALVRPGHAREDTQASLTGCGQHVEEWNAVPGEYALLKAQPAAVQRCHLGWTWGADQAGDLWTCTTFHLPCLLHHYAALVVRCHLHAFRQCGADQQSVAGHGRIAVALNRRGWPGRSASPLALMRRSQTPCRGWRSSSS